MTRATPAVDGLHRKKFSYGTLLSDSQLNASASVPEHSSTHPVLARCSLPANTLPRLFLRHRISRTTLRYRLPCPSRHRKTPAIHWSTPDPINSATPLGPDQLNARASVPGTSAYSPSAGETLGPGTHTLAVTFTPADSVNYTPAQANVSLTVAEFIPASVTWPDPARFLTERLSALSS